MEEFFFPKVFCFMAALLPLELVDMEGVRAGPCVALGMQAWGWSSPGMAAWRGTCQSHFLWDRWRLGGMHSFVLFIFSFFFYKLNSKRGKIKAGCMVLLSFDVPRRCWKCRFSWEFLREHQQGSVLSHAASHPSCPSQKPGCCQGAVTHPAWHRHCCPAAECYQCLPGLTAGP